jgi:hypothetical protein
MYELYTKSEEADGENKLYRKKVSVREPVGYFYDEEMRSVMALSSTMLSQIRNDGNNNFNSINKVSLVNFGKIVSARFCKYSKYITFLTADLLLFQLKNFETHIGRCLRVTFSKENSSSVQGIMVDYHYCAELELMFILNSNRELYIFERSNSGNQVLIKLEEMLPYKLRNLNFNRF